MTSTALLLLALISSVCVPAQAQDLEKDAVRIDQSNGVMKLIFDSKINTNPKYLQHSSSPKAPGALEPMLDETDLPDTVLPLAIPSADEPGSVKLKGGVQKSGKRDEQKKLNALDAKIASPGSQALDGQSSVSVTQEEINIEWNKWRNKVSHAIWAKFCQYLQGGDTLMFGNYYWKYGNNPPLKFPDNTRATYFVTIDSDMNVVDAKITRSSGNTKFDDIVQRSAESVNRKKFLRFPAGSKRKQVTLSLQLFTSKHGGYKDIDFNDVERYTASSSDSAR